MTDESAREQALAWLAQDPDQDTRSELQALLDDPSEASALRERFAGTLQFGTAGLRGSNQSNFRKVLQAN